MIYASAVNALTKFGPVHSGSYNIYNIIRKCIVEKTATVTGEWLNINSAWDWVDEPNIHKENTYKGCVDLSIKSHSGKITVKIVIWNGDDGYPINKRCQFDIILNRLPKEVESLIVWHIKKCAKQQIEEEDQLLLTRREQDRFEILMQLIEIE